VKRSPMTPTTRGPTPLIGSPASWAHRCGRLALVLLLFGCAVSCTPSSNYSAKAWSSYDILLVVQANSKLVLEGVDTKTGHADALTTVARFDNSLVPEASIFLSGDTGYIVVNTGSDPFSAEVFDIDRPTKSLRDLGPLAAGRLPVMTGSDQLTAFGSSGNGYLQTTISLPGLGNPKTSPFAVVPYGSDGSCTLGTGSAGQGPAVIAEGTTVGPFPLTPSDVASSVACGGGRQVVTVSGRIDPSTSEKQEPTTVAQLAVVDAQGTLQRWPTAGKPRLVCLLDQDRAVVDIEDQPGHRAAQVVDVRTGAAAPPVPLGDLQSVGALSCDHDTIVAVGDNRVVVVNPTATGQDPTSIELTGPARTSVIRW